jgi:hypothetical protein
MAVSSASSPRKSQKKVRKHTIDERIARLSAKRKDVLKRLLTEYEEADARERAAPEWLEDLQRADEDVQRNIGVMVRFALKGGSL